MGQIVLNSVTFSYMPYNNQVVTVEYKLASDTTYTEFTDNAVVLPDGTFSPAVIITALADGADYNIRVTNNCNGMSKEINLTSTGVATTTTSTTTTTTLPVITGIIDAILTGGSTIGGPVRMTINFDSPVPTDFQFKWGFDITATGGGYSSLSTYPPPKTFAPASTTCGGGVVTVTSSSVTITDDSQCTEYGAPYGYISKLVFYDAILPSGYTLVLTPARSDLDWEIR